MKGKSILIIILCSVVHLVSAQRSFEDNIQNKYESYVRKYPPSKFNIILNQKSYIPGDTVFMSVYFTDLNYRSVFNEQIVNLDLYAYNGERVANQLFRIAGGLTNTQLALPSNLSSGIYKIVCYTDWMRNFGQEFFYSQELVISSSNDFQIKKSKIQIHTEGGNLVSGLTNKVILNTVPNSVVSILDEGGNILSKVKVDQNGIGKVNLRIAQPVYALINGDNNKAALPPLINDGITLKLDTVSYNKFYLEISEKSVLKNKDLYAVLISGGQLLMVRGFQMNDNRIFELPLELRNYRQSYCQLYIIDNKGNELAQRTFMPNALNDVKVKLSSLKSSIQRDSTELSFLLQDSSGDLPIASASISIVQNNLFNNFAVNPMLYSELPEVLSWVTRNQINDISRINDFLISQKWNKIKWTDVLSGIAPQMKHTLRKQLVIKGEVRNLSNGTIPDSTMIVGYLQNNAIGYESFSKNGRFELPVVYDFWGKDNIFLTSKYKGASLDRNVIFSIVEDSLTEVNTWENVDLNKKLVYSEYALKREIVNKSYNFFQSSGKKVEIKSPNQVLEDEFQGADYTVKVDDYIVFPSMEDFLKEVVSFVQIKKRDGQPSLRIYYRIDKSIRYYEYDPLIIIDGVMTKNSSVLFTLNPKDLLYIKLINNPNKLTQLGKLGESGVVFIESRKGNLNQNIKSNTFPVVGLTKPVNPSDKLVKNGIPDLRSNLYWNPMLKLSASKATNIPLFTSDDLGPLRVIITGITIDGRLFHHEETIEVGENKNR